MEKCTPQNQLDLKDIKVKARVKKVKVKKNNFTQKNFLAHTIVPLSLVNKVMNSEDSVDGRSQKKKRSKAGTSKILLQRQRIQTVPCYCQEIIFSRIKGLYECICSGQRGFDF